MKITTEITDRDKKLLLFLAIFVIVVVFGFFIIRPLAETDAALKEELAVQEELQIRTQQKLMLLPSMQANVEKTEEELAAAAKDFYQVMKSQEIDKLLTGIALSWGLESRQLVIQMPEGEMILDPFYASQAALEEMLSQAIGQDGEEQTDTVQKTSTSFYGIYAAQVMLTVKGERSVLEQMADEISEDYPAIRITGAVWGKENSSLRNEAGEYVSSLNDTLQLQMEIYMYKRDE